MNARTECDRRQSSLKFVVHTARQISSTDNFRKRQRHHESAISSENGTRTETGTNRSHKHSRSIITTRSVQNALQPSPSNDRALETLGQVSSLAAYKPRVALSNPI